MAEKIILVDHNFGSIAKVTGLPLPTVASDAASKAYVDGIIEPYGWKDNVRVATASNISIASPGATLDGVTMAVNDRVLVRGQTAQPENGIYIWNGAAVPMTRSADATDVTEMRNATVTVDEGTSASTTWRQSTLTGTIGTANIVWVAFGTAAPAASTTVAGIVELADQTEVDAGTDNTRAITSQGLANWSGRIRKFPQTIGDGTQTSIAVTHNLNTRDIDVSVYQAAGTFDKVECEVELTSVNQITLRFNVAPASNSLRVVVIG